MVTKKIVEGVKSFVKETPITATVFSIGIPASVYLAVNGPPTSYTVEGTTTQGNHVAALFGKFGEITPRYGTLLGYENPDGSYTLFSTVGCRDPRLNQVDDFNVQGDRITYNRRNTSTEKMADFERAFRGKLETLIVQNPELTENPPRCFPVGFLNF